MRRLDVIALTVFLALASQESLLASTPDEEEPAPDEAVAAQPNVFHDPVQLAASDGVIDSSAAWGHSSPWVEDVDGDGVRDLVVGDFSGLFRFYRNRGTEREPHYAASVNLQAGGVDAKVPIY